MAQTELKLRVRPTKVAILLAETASADQLLLAVRFLSRLWGGRYCPMLPVTTTANDSRGRRWLAEARPELVYGIGVDHDGWNHVVREVCQPRDYVELTPDFVDQLHTPHVADLITVLPVLRHHQRQAAVMRLRPTRLVGCEESSPLYSLVQVMFGCFDPRLGTQAVSPQEPSCWVSSEWTVSDFINLCRTFTQQWHRTWLDVANTGLTPLRFGFSHDVPVIIVVESPADLALAWNLRAAGDSDFPPRVIPVPAGSVTEAPVLEALDEWLAALEPFTGRCSVENLNPLAAVRI